MSNKKQTAVEWLMEQITYDNGFGERRNSFVDSFDLSEFFEQAKELEKEQIEDAFCDGVDDEYEHHINDKIRKNSEEYYNETFKKL